MKIIICGAGQVGWQIARQLAGEGNEITLIDNNPELIRRASDTLDVKGLTGFASYPDVLARAGARDADMIIAATHSDEVNMIACQVAHSIFSVPRKIARLRAKSYLEALNTELYRDDHLPIDVVISPEREVADAALQRLAAPSTFDSESFMNGRAQLLGLELDADCPVLNTPLRQLSELFSTLRAIVVGVRRGERLFAPEPEDQLFADDRIYLFVQTEDLTRAQEIFGKSTRKIERAIIIGAGHVGLELATTLEQRSDRLRTRIIEKSLSRAEFAADALERTIVLSGDGLDLDLLTEAGVARSDAVLALTDDDKTNLLAAVRGKQAGARMAIALINDPSLVSMAASMEIDAYINPRAITVSSILRHIRHGRVRAVYSIGDGEAEMIEAQVLGTSSLAGQFIRDIEFPEGAIVAAVMRPSGKIEWAQGNLRLMEGDVIAIFVMAQDVPAVERLLQVSIDFF